MSVIETRGLGKRYARGRVVALEDLDLDVREGEIFGFLGPNGAGKSTTIRLLLGYLHATTGSARVLGHDIRAGSVEIRREVGYLPGGIAFWDGSSGERVLDELSAMSGRPPVRRAALLDRLELSAGTLRRPVRDYSRGMRQKLGIVQALQHDPRLAILDEPSEGLDPLMQRAFYDILDDLRAAGRTIFFSSHVLSEVERVCDRVGIVRAGRLVALEDIGALLARRRRLVEIRSAPGGAVPPLEAVPGVGGVRVDGERVSLHLDGDAGPLLAALAGTAVADLSIEPARLEDAFLEFYERDEADAGPGSGATGPVPTGATGPTPRDATGPVPRDAA